MKNNHCKRIAAALALAAGALWSGGSAGVAGPGGGGPYEMRSEVIGSGGGVSSGGQYTMMDTIGQPAVESLSGGPYVFAPGFWSAEASVQVPMELTAFVIR